MQDLWSLSPLIYFFHMHTTIQPKYIVLFHLFFCAQPFNQKLGSSLIISFICPQPFDQIIWPSFNYSFCSARPFNQKLGSPLIQFFICTWSFNQMLVLINLLLLFAHDHSTKLHGPRSCIISLVHNHSTKN